MSGPGSKRVAELRWQGDAIGEGRARVIGWSEGRESGVSRGNPDKIAGNGGEREWQAAGSWSTGEGVSVSMSIQGRVVSEECVEERVISRWKGGKVESVE